MHSCEKYSNPRTCRGGLTEYSANATMITPLPPFSSPVKYNNACSIRTRAIRLTCSASTQTTRRNREH